jgi:hypothetical protein
MGSPILPASTLPGGYFQSSTPQFSALVSSIQGNAGSSADGFDAASALVANAFPAIEEAMATSDSMIGLVDALSIDLANTPDTLDGSLAALDSLYHQMESDLGTSIDALQSIGGALTPFSIAGMPALPNLIVPAVIDIAAIVQELFVGIEQTVEMELQAVWDNISWMESAIYQFQLEFWEGMW